MKILVLVAFSLIGFMASVKAQISFTYDNLDNQSYTFKLRNGSERTAVTFEPGLNKEMVIQAAESTVYIASKCPEVPIKNGARVEIAQGCLRLKKKGK
jgi:hypothetical protein